ncbi:ketoacyl-ACP synthase III [Rhodohalobacter sp. SW132]|uniref:beta-ketoacyl-ACP synthase III n=1 Tax=Rhodohalobacter sp. SW132 TaxID=2293433 RepID=UPI000E24D1B5|nr:beta-ketoacyl-ACP synthase III [Rhodohalobacter sp. SW132]REL33669.1 ketoacyl-ACP synthase III [Rhodohalobacter sp. SW132]
MPPIYAKITGVGKYLPDYILTNKELETMVDTNDEWITSRTGISERRILKGEGRGTSYMASRAAKAALEDADVDPDEIDAIIVATVTPDYLFPATACLVQKQIGADKAYAFDLSAACSGFLFALTTGGTMIESGRAKKVLVIGADKMSSILDYSDRTTCILFGDAGAAVLLEATDEKVGIIDYIHYTDGDEDRMLYQPAGGSVMPATEQTVEQKLHFLRQEGRSVFKRATEGMADVSLEIMEKNNLAPDDVSWLVPHQANLRIIDATARRMGLDKEKVMINISKYGNTTSATIPLCLADWNDELSEGDNLVLSAFGGGLTWGSIFLKWGK